MEKYDPAQIEPKWQKVWRQKKIFQPDLKKAKKPFYNLMMFPYPSGEGLHVGNMYAFTGADIYGRFKRMQGFDVFEPIGLDGFGIHSENYAIKLGKHPAEVAKKTEKNFYRQLEATGNAYAWDNTLETYDPDYYKWTQWVFIQMFKHGLAYRKKNPVNWCPSCKTVLADEQVVAGVCERCGSQVKQKELAQWFFKITAYAERLLKNLEWIDWSEKVKIGQRNWIGKSQGAEIEFPLETTLRVGESREAGGRTLRVDKISVFTTRPDTLFGATFMVLAPEHSLVKKLTTGQYKSKVEGYVKEAVSKTEIERIAEGKLKTGVFTGSYCVNPINGEKIPIWVADYVVMSYGLGAIMGVPAHDKRDYEFAQKFNLEIRPVIGSFEGKEVYDGPGVLINSVRWNGLKVPEEMGKVIDWLEEKGVGKKTVRYKIRDWCVSRQRYWGPPIPMINCPKCGWVPVSEKDLPVLLPRLSDFQPKGLGKSPLAQLEDWINVSCPQCGGFGQRETDVSDTFLDSAWYFFRYPSTRSARFSQVPFDSEITKKWLPVDMYIGGAEHTVLHLMYSRFITMAFCDFDLIDFEEPYRKFYAHGLITKDGAKMSKSKGNVVIPDEYIKVYGADTLRMYLMFLGPFDQGGDFTDAGIEGITRFLKKVWRLSNEAMKQWDNGTIKQVTVSEINSSLHRLIKKVGEDIEAIKFNTAIAAMMEFVNSWTASQPDSLTVEEVKTFLRLLAPFAPHITEELYQRLQQFNNPTMKQFISIHTQPWPKYDPKLLEEEEVTIVVQIDGKVREKLKVQSAISNQQSAISKLVRESAKVQKYLANKEIKDVIFVSGRLINFVVEKE